MQNEINKIKTIIDNKRREIEERNKKEMEKMRRFYNQKIIKNDLLKFGKEIEIYQNEIKSIENNNLYWVAWKNYQNLVFDPKNMKWRIIPICACMPSNKPENIIWINNCEKFIPKIYNFVKSLKGVRNAIISRMGTNTKLHVHRGWACVSNHILRCHLPIIIEEEKSGLIVFEEKQYHDVKKYIIFDDSMEHTGFNESKMDRYVLIIDIERPKNADKGVSRVEFTKGMTPDDVMKNFQKINKYYGNLKN